MAVHGLLRLEQAKQNKTNDSLTFEADTGPREGLLPSQLQPKQEPNKSSSLRTRCHKVLRATTCPQVPQADGRTHFYMECDITLTVYIRTLRAQWRESL